VRVTEADFLASFGRRNDEILAAWLGAGAEAQRIRRIGDAKEVCYREMILADGLVPLPGAAEWVRALHDAGWRQAIASSAPLRALDLSPHSTMVRRVPPRRRPCPCRPGAPTIPAVRRGAHPRASAGNASSRLPGSGSKKRERTVTMAVFDDTCGNLIQIASEK
jgi:hypothetical protein